MSCEHMHFPAISPFLSDRVTYNLICTLKLCICSLTVLQLAYSVFLLEFFCQNHRLSVNSVLLLQGDMPTFRFEVLYHFWQGLVAYWLVISIID